MFLNQYNDEKFIIVLMTAGKAKKEMPRRAQKEAMILPGHVMGTASP